MTELTNMAPLVECEVLPPRTMTWKCLDCRGTFQGPTNRPPSGGCAHCGSTNVIDCNAAPVVGVIFVFGSRSAARRMSSRLAPGEDVP